MLYIGFSGLPIRSNRKSAELISMTQLEVAYRYNGSPGESAMRAIDNMREVYGIRRISGNSNDRIVRGGLDAWQVEIPTIPGVLKRARQRSPQIGELKGKAAAIGERCVSI